MSIYIVAEVGINHNGDLSICKELIDAAVVANCDAVKFQKRDIDEVYTREFLDSLRESPWGTTQRDQKLGIEFSEDDYIFLDVRSIKEHKVKAIPNTPNIPVQELENRIDELEIYRDKKIVVYCRSGNRSKLGTDILNKNGYDAVNLIGGMIEWDGPIISKN